MSISERITRHRAASMDANAGNRPPWQVAPIAAFAAALANLAVFMFARMALHLPLRLARRPGALELVPLSVGAIVGASVVPALAATLLFAGLRRASRRPLAWFVAIAGAVLAISLVPVAAIAVDAASTRVVLGLMHVIAAATIIGVIAATQSRGERRSKRKWERIVPTALLGIMYLPPSIAKLAGKGHIADNFRAWGLPDWLLYGTGALQLLGVLLLVHPATALIGALVLASSAIESAVMNGMHGAGALIVFPLFQLAFSFAVAWLNRPRRPHA
jgi:hypothetical protein